MSSIYPFIMYHNFFCNALHYTQAEWRGALVAVKIIASSTQAKLHTNVIEAITGRMLSHPHVVHTYLAVVASGEEMLEASKAQHDAFESPSRGSRKNNGFDPMCPEAADADEDMILSELMDSLLDDSPSAAECHNRGSFSSSKDRGNGPPSMPLLAAEAQLQARHTSPHLATPRSASGPVAHQSTTAGSGSGSSQFSLTCSEKPPGMIEHVRQQQQPQVQKPRRRLMRGSSNLRPRVLADDGSSVFSGVVCARASCEVMQPLPDGGILGSGSSTPDPCETSGGLLQPRRSSLSPNPNEMQVGGLGWQIHLPEELVDEGSCNNDLVGLTKGEHRGMIAASSPQRGGTVLSPLQCASPRQGNNGAGVPSGGGTAQRPRGTKAAGDNFSLEGNALGPAEAMSMSEVMSHFDVKPDNHMTALVVSVALVVSDPLSSHPFIFWTCVYFSPSKAPHGCMGYISGQSLTSHLSNCLLHSDGVL